MYAEAVGEDEGKKYLNQVRARAGLVGYGDADYPKEYNTIISIASKIHTCIIRNKNDYIR